MAVLENGIWQNDKDISELKNIDKFGEVIIPEPNRYHLYMSYACPFAHRPFLTINYMGLNDIISVSSVGVVRYDKGWEFNSEYSDEINNKSYLYEVFTKHKSDYSGGVVVPVLWDKKENKVVSTDSNHIATELATNWKDLAKNKTNLIYGDGNEQQQLQNWLHDNINRKVYIAGFANKQDIYDKAINELFDAMAEMDNRLANKNYLFGETITLADFFLFASLVRCESVYEIHFKANKKPLKQFTNLYAYLKRLITIPEIKSTINMPHLKDHYYLTHKHINPHGIVPAGPNLEWWED